MGNNLSTELANGVEGLQPLPIETQLRIQLQNNHYPPVPVSMVPVCIAAIDAFYDEATERLIELPEGITWRGKTSAPAWAIAEQHHLDAWLPHAWYCDCPDCKEQQTDKEI